MSNRKKSNVQLENPFKLDDISQQLVPGRTSSANVSRTIEWKNKDYYPICGLHDLLNENEKRYLRNVESSVHNIDPSIALAINKLVSEGKYIHVAKIITRLPRSNQYETMFRNAFASITQQEPLSILSSILIPQVIGNYTIPELVEQILQGGYQRGSHVKSKVTQIGEFANPIYVVGRYFIGYTPVVNVASKARDMMQSIYSGIEAKWPVIPLMVLVVQKPYVEYLQAHRVNDLPVSADIMELWVDASLDSDESPHPIHTAYIRQIRNPLMKQGVKLVVKDNLRNEFGIPPTAPKFKTIKEEKDWTKARALELVNKERRKYNVDLQHQEATVEISDMEYPF